MAGWESRTSPLVGAFCGLERARVGVFQGVAHSGLGEHRLGAPEFE